MQNTTSNNFVLVGAMGSGKSTIGFSLARILRRQFIDTDTLVQQFIGISITEIFTRYGEDYFRAIETAVLHQLQNCHNTVIATGGGVVIKQQNRVLIKKLGTVIYLEAKIENIQRRVKYNNNRPLLQVPNSQKYIKETIDQRKQHYQNLAQILVRDNWHKEQKLHFIIEQIDKTSSSDS